MDNMCRARYTIECEIRRCKSLHYRFVRRLSRFPPSSINERLSFVERKGTRYYSSIWYDNGKRMHRYIGKEDHSTVKLIQEQYFLTRGISMLDEHIDRLNSCTTILNHFDCEAFNAALPKAYQLSEDHLKDVVGFNDEERWYASSLSEKAKLDANFGVKYPSGRRHIAKDGTVMRSKSEVSIANEFIDRGKPYIYEMPLEIVNSVLHPDFTFYSNRFGRVIRWEHVGMLDDSGYMDDFSDRADIYTKGGYVLCVDVIFSFDTKGGNIDTRIIKKILDEYQ